MLKNEDYDLVHTLSTKSQGMEVYDTYIKDAQTCPSCRDLWQKIKQDDDRHIQMLAQELKKHVEKGSL